MRKGHDAWSCDLVDTEMPGQHIIADAIEVIYSTKWDLVIAHPPCTYFAKAGLHYLKDNPERQRKQKLSLEFVKAIFNSPAPYIAIENPMGSLHHLWQRPSQLVYPWYWGDPYDKDICLWLKNLPPLRWDYSIQEPAKLKSVKNHVNGRMTQEQKAKIKSRFFNGISEAMADQWGSLPVLHVPGLSGALPPDVTGTSLDRRPVVPGSSQALPLDVTRLSPDLLTNKI